MYPFGSCAYGTVPPQSDLDLLVVAESRLLDAYQRNAAAYRTSGDGPIAIDAQAYTRKGGLTSGPRCAGNTRRRSHQGE